MPTLREQLVVKLSNIPDVTLDLYKDTQLLCVNYKGKEVAHFQTGSNNELDIRLTPAIIKQEQLVQPATSKSHPSRSKNSRWIVLGFTRSKDLDKLTRLVELAIQLR